MRCKGLKREDHRFDTGFCLSAVVLLCLGWFVTGWAMDEKKIIELPKPVMKGTTSLEEAVARRASVRDFAAKPLAPQEISQLLWAAQGVTRNWGGRTVPSAGALYPLETYLVTAEGLFQYLPARHQLLRLKDHNLMKDLCHAALGQAPTREAPAVIVLTAEKERRENTAGGANGMSPWRPVMRRRMSSCRRRPWDWVPSPWGLSTMTGCRRHSVFPKATGPCI